MTLQGRIMIVSQFMNTKILVERVKSLKMRTAESYDVGRRVDKTKDMHGDATAILSFSHASSSTRHTLKMRNNCFSRCQKLEASVFVFLKRENRDIENTKD